MTRIPFTATLPDGTHVLVDIWADTDLPIRSLTLATRERPSDVWSPPVDATKAA